jgi:oligopeptide/dipeptide ABC transporter ATP-binding protein
LLVDVRSDLGDDKGMNARGAADSPPLLRVQGLEVAFPVRDSGGATVATLVAVDRVSFEVQRHEVLALVGESGSGKTTTGLAILRLVPPTAGEVWFRQEDLAALKGRRLRRVRRDLQIVFQNPQSSLNPRLRVSALLAEPLRVHRVLSGADTTRRVREVLDLVGLSPATSDKYTFELSGGQQQRVAIARALMLEPAFLVLDEAVSALDVSIRAQILNLLSDLHQRLDLTYLFISHDLSVVSNFADRVAVMYLGKIVELAECDDFFAGGALHPYSRALLSAVPIPNPRQERQRRRILLSGDVPSPLERPSGCTFHTRCPWKQPVCSEVEPELATVESGQSVACHFWSEIAASELTPRETTVSTAPRRAPRG